MKNSIIIQVANDKYEFIENFWETTEECAEYFGTNPSKIRDLIFKHRKKKYNLERVWLNKNYEEEQNERQN